MTHFTAHARHNLLIFGALNQESPCYRNDGRQIWSNKALTCVQRSILDKETTICRYPAIRACAGLCWRRAKIHSQFWRSRSYRSSGIGTRTVHFGKIHFSKR
jgi:hypothetical protein